MDTPKRSDGPTPEIGYHWHPIEDLPDDWRSLADPELKFWITAWESKRESLEKHAEMGRYLERLKREWSIETGMIENLYRWEPGVTQTLIEHGFRQDLLESSHIEGDPVLIGKLLNSQLAALEMVMDYVGGGRPLSEADILDLHKVLTEHQDSAPGVHQGKRTEIKLLKGEYKRWPNNPTRPDGAKHQYCPPEQVKPQIEQLLIWHQEHMAQGVAPEVEAAWLHHRFVQIHPFQDGNGRVARCLAAMVMIKAGAFPLVVHFADRPNYYDALQQADGGDLGSLTKLFTALEREEIKQVMELEGKLEGGALEEVIRVGSEILLKGEELASVRDTAKLTAEGLINEGSNQQLEIRSRLIDSIGTGNYRFELEKHEKAQWNHTFDRMILEKAGLLQGGELEFFRSSTLIFDAPHSRSFMVLAIFQTQRPYDGRFCADLFFMADFRTLPTELQKVLVSTTLRLVDAAFVFSYRDEFTAVSENFGRWLNSGLTRGLALWFEQERRIIDALAEQETPPST